jgi:ABC-2 type transport system ATP-binding protein
MRQRLGIAAALLGDPGVLVFDEPVNGLDLDGVRWVRSLLRGFADEGRAVLVSSHLMSEVQQVADRVVVIGRGRLIADADVADVLRGLGGRRVRVRTPQPEQLARALAGRAELERTGADELEVIGLAAADIGDAAHAGGVRVHHLADVEQSLEQAYLSLTEQSVEYAGAPANGAAPGEEAR